MVITFLTGSITTPAATVRVRKDGTGNYTTIQAAVNAMAARDICLVGPGYYPERITFPTGKSGSATSPTTLRAETNGTVEIWGFDTRNCNFLRLEGFNIAPTNNGAFGVYLRSSNVQVVSNFITGARGGGVVGSGSGSSNYVAWNHIYRAGKGIIITGNAWLVEGNDVERLQKYPEVDDADFTLVFGAYHVIRSNFYHGTLQSEIGEAHVDGFQSWDNNGEYIQHVRIEANRLQGFYHQGVIMQAGFYTNSYDIVICNNEFIEATTAGVLVFASVRDVFVFNNLFKDINSIGVGINSGATGEVRNNIFYNVCCYDSSTSPSIGSKNIWYRPGSTQGSRFSGDLVNVNPQFVDVTNGNYHLRPTSPAINAGVALPSVMVDIEGLSRPQGGSWDIGPYEYKVSSPSLSSPVKQGTNFSFVLTGEIGRAYSIQSSTNLLNWSPARTVTLSNTTSVVSLPGINSRLFFRALLIP